LIPCLPIDKGTGQPIRKIIRERETITVLIKILIWKKSGFGKIQAMNYCLGTFWRRKPLPNFC
jgi:hypothetical protein